MKIQYGGEIFEMSMADFYLQKKAKEIINKLINNPELMDEFNKQMRQVKLKKINDGLKNR